MGLKGAVLLFVFLKSILIYAFVVGIVPVSSFLLGRNGGKIVRRRINEEVN